MRWAGHVAQMRNMRVHTGIWSENLTGETGVEGDKIKIDIKGKGVICGLNSTGSGYGPVAALF